MMITENVIIERMEQLKRQQQSLQANLHAVDGALQDCEFWLLKLQSRGSDAPDSSGE